MKELKQFPTTDYNKFPQKYYFESIAKNIIKIGNLKNTNKIILDFGCGQKIFSKILKDKKIINYDIKPEYTECQTYEDYSFDIAIFNHVLMYLYPSQIEELLNKIKKIYMLETKICKNVKKKKMLVLNSEKFKKKTNIKIKNWDKQISEMKKFFLRYQLPIKEKILK